MYESMAFNIILLVVGIIAVIAVLRPVFLWYWRINKTVSLLEEQADQNRYIIDLLQTQNKQMATMLSSLQAQLNKPAGQPEQSGIFSKSELS